MSSLYPTLEDMSVDRMVQAQTIAEQQMKAAIPSAPGAMYPTGAGPPPYSVTNPVHGEHSAELYPSLNEYMGLTITQDMIDQQRALLPVSQSVQVGGARSDQMVAPLTGDHNVAVMRAEIKPGLREVIVCKDQNGYIGLRVKSVNKGIFVSFVHSNSPAALGGLRFGDQILQINGQNTAGWDTDKAMKALKDAAPQKITIAVRDRPFERTITLQKSSVGTVGFVFKVNKITAIVKDSSAARNGVLIDHYLVEVNGQNVVGLKEEEIKDIFVASGPAVTITILPSFIYQHIMSSIGTSLVKKFMDHSVPDV